MIEERGNDELEELSIQKLKQYFFLMAPIRNLRGEDFQFLKSKDDEKLQQLLFQELFGNQHSRLFKVEAKYKRLFLKRLINEIESSGLEVIANVYDEYMQLMMSSDPIEEFCFKSYFLDTLNVNIVIKQSTQILSSGTTGLISWEACYALCEWVASNQQIFKSKVILELGSGAGLLGVFCCKICEVNSYIFSDHHKKVLELLQDNIKINNIGEGAANDFDIEGEICLENDVSTDEVGDVDKGAPSDLRRSISNEKHISIVKCDCCRSHALPKCKVQCLQLDWQDKKCFDLLEERNIDTIIGSDLVYDSSIIPALVNVLFHALRKSSKMKAIIATTVRNEDTYQCFLNHLGVSQLEWRLVDMKTRMPLFVYENSSKIEIIEINAKSESQ